MFTDLIGKGGRICSIPIPDWVSDAVHIWLVAAQVTNGEIFRAINKAGRIATRWFSPKVIWGVVNEAAGRCGFAEVAPHDLRRTCARLCHQWEESLNKFSSYSDMSVFKRQNGT